jgi:beta-fructofuranosidase
VLLIGAGLTDGTACVLTYASPAPSLTDWTYTGVLAARDGALDDPVWTGRAWECPQLVEIDGRHVLIVSAWSEDRTHYSVAAVGTYADGRFEADGWQRLTHGPGHYAASAFRDAEGAPCLMMWIRDVGDDDAGWAGAQSVPLQMDVTDDRLAITPHPVLEARRIAIDGSAPADAWDVEWHPADGASLSVVSQSGRRLAELTVTDDAIDARVGDGEPVAIPRTADVVRVIVDGPIIEVFATHTTYAGSLDTRREPVRVDVDDSATVWRLA